MRKYIYIFLTTVFMAVSIYTLNSWMKYEKINDDGEEKEREFNDPARLHQEFLMLRDPNTNKIPENIRYLELRYAETLPHRQEAVLYKGMNLKNTQGQILSWTERGPNNIGGRTKALGVDVTNTSRLIAGGVTGGLWKSTDGGSSWVQKTTVSQFQEATCLAQDTRTGQEATWYAGTGEYGSSGGATGATLTGNGLYKSTNNGESWTLLTNTQTNDVGFSSGWQFIWNVAVDKNSGGSGIVYVAAYGGIYRSSDGGTNWGTAQSFGSTGNASYTDIQVTSTGIAYATGSSNDGSASGIYKSNIGGTTWSSITPAGFPASYKRIVIAISPSNESIVYFFAQTPGNGKQQKNGDVNEWVSLWRYDASASSGSEWTNLSSNLPTYSSQVAGLSTQGSYNMIVKVKPDNANYVIVGGTNIYRCADVTAGTPTWTWIAGYSPADNVSTYPNHHPDNHSFAFVPGSNTAVYSGHDGGISYTTDITATAVGTHPVTWTYKNNGYNVTQFYNLAIAPEANSNTMIGGAQDNGNEFTTSAGLSSWTVGSEGGDGCYNAIAPTADNRVYRSTQNGEITAWQSDMTTYVGALKPTGSANPLFVNPFALDPNNSNYLYYAAGNASSTTGLWRHNSVKTATDGTVDNTTGWTYLTSAHITGGEQVSAIGISVSPANVVYYGTSNGTVKRIDNANSGASPTVTNITTGLPSSSYVSSISVDPTNSAKVLVTFSNYGINKIWYSTDSGANWTNVGNTLNAAQGPSIRSAAIFYINSTVNYFVGTSTGLYYTNTLNGGSTVWTSEGDNTIGPLIVNSMVFRTDAGGSNPTSGTLAVATHGRGVFSASISSPLPVELISFTGVYENSKVQLFWKTATELNNYGFEIERRLPSGQWSKIGFIPGHGNSNSLKSYSYLDSNLPSGIIEYRLKQIDFNGKFEYSNVLQVEVASVSRMQLAQNYPNPFNPLTNIVYDLPSNTKVKLVIYDITGRQVVTLVDGFQYAGNHKIEFNGSNLASGVYIYSITTLQGVISKKMLLMK